MIDEGKTDGLFGAKIHEDTQAAKVKLLALQERHGEFMKVSTLFFIASLFSTVSEKNMYTLGPF